MCGDLLNGSGMRGVTGLRTRDGKSRRLGERISEEADPCRKPGINGLILKFFMLFLLSYSFEEVCLLGPVRIGGIEFFGAGSDLAAAAFLAVSEDPVSI